MITELGPWPLGRDNVNPWYSDEFQLPSEGESPARLTSATDVDLDNDGWPKTRVATTDGVSCTSPKGMWFPFGVGMFQDGTSLKRLTSWDTAATVATLSSSATVEMREFGNQIVWSNGTDKGCIVSGVNTNWGLEACPAPTLTQTTGALAAGVYLVGGQWKDAYGRLSGTVDFSRITMDGSHGFTVGFGTPPTGATHVEVFVSKPNQTQSRYNKTVAVGALPTTITAQSASRRPCRGLGKRPPPASSVIIPYRSMLLVYATDGANHVLVPSVGPSLHQFDYRKALAFPEAVVDGMGIDEGFWVVTARSSYWVPGSVNEWNPTSASQVRFAKGSMVCSAAQLPFMKLGYSANVAVFVSERGLAVGLPGGQMYFPTQGRYHFDVTKSYQLSIQYRQMSWGVAEQLVIVER